METSSLHIENKETSDYQKLKSLAIKLKKELDLSKNKIIALECDLKNARHVEVTDKRPNEIDKINLADILSLCSHKVGDDQENSNINAISSLKKYCNTCIDTAQGHLDTYMASAKASSKFKADFEALTLANRHLQEENERLNGQVGRLHQEMGTIEDNKELLRIKDLEIEGFEKSLFSLKSELQNKDGRILDLENKSQEKDNKIAELDTCIARFNTEKECFIERESEQIERINGLEAQLSDSKARVTTLTEEKENLSQRFEEIEAKLQITLNESARENKLCNDKIDRLSAVNHELEDKLETTKDRLAAETLNSQKLAQELNKCCLEHEKYKVRVHQILNEQTTKCDVAIQTVACSQESKDIAICESCERLKNALEKVDSNYAALRERLTTLQREKEDSISKETLVKRNVSNNLSLFDSRTSRLLEGVENRQIDCQVKLEILQKKLLLFVATLEKRTSRLTSPPNLPIAPQTITLTNGRKPSEHSPSPTEIPSQNKSRDTKCQDIKDHTNRRKDRTGRRKRSLDLLIDDWLQKSSNLESSDRDPQPLCPLSPCDPPAGEAEMRIAHLQELLGENEGQVRRLSEQVEVLKREIRRLDQAQREPPKSLDMTGKEHLDEVAYEHKLEYLKNVFYKFLCPEIDLKQRKSLVPVINTILALTPTQQQTLKLMAECRDETLLKPLHQQSESYEMVKGTQSGYTLGNILPSSITSYLQR